MTLLSTSSCISVDREPARCFGGHGLIPVADSDFLFIPRSSRVMLIISPFALLSLFTYQCLFITYSHNTVIGNVILGGTKAIKKSQPLAPTREVLSFRTYTARRKMARLRRCACVLYQSEPLGHVIRKIESEVENGRLAIRPDKKLHADLG